MRTADSATTKVASTSAIRRIGVVDADVAGRTDETSVEACTVNVVHPLRKQLDRSTRMRIGNDIDFPMRCRGRASVI
jgi:hypothetical protein